MLAPYQLVIDLYRASSLSLSLSLFFLCNANVIEFNKSPNWYDNITFKLNNFWIFKKKSLVSIEALLDWTGWKINLWYGASAIDKKKRRQYNRNGWIVLLLQIRETHFGKWCAVFQSDVINASRRTVLKKMVELANALRVICPLFYFGARIYVCVQHDTVT